MNILTSLLEILAIATSAAKVALPGNTDVQSGTALAAALEQIALKSISAYQVQTGTPLDLTKLHPETPIS